MNIERVAIGVLVACAGAEALTYCQIADVLVGRAHYFGINLLYDGSIHGRDYSGLEPVILTLVGVELLQCDDPFTDKPHYRTTPHGSVLLLARRLV